MIVASDHGHSELYSSVLLRPELVLRRAQQPGTLREALRLFGLLDPDEYTRFLEDYYRAGLQRIGEDWDYADIVTVLSAAAQLVQPARYLEIGVRRGRSLAAVVTQWPGVQVFAADMWMQSYGNNPNPGPDWVTAQMARLGYSLPIVFLNGDSHLTIPKLLREQPELRFDLITVDGDHSYNGALTDLRNVMPRLALGGVIVFDDISHPRHPQLLDAWRTAIAADGGILTAEFTGLGYGVAVGVRHWLPGGPPGPQAASRLYHAMQRVPGIGRAVTAAVAAIRARRS